MSFRLKLSLAFGSILALTVIVAMTSIYGMGRALACQKELYTFTHQLEKKFQRIARQQNAYSYTGAIEHSRAFFDLTQTVRIDLDNVIKKSQDEDQKREVSSLLSDLDRYEKTFVRFVQIDIDMETMKSRLLHESRRLSANVNAIEKVGDKAIGILKMMNETLVAEKGFMLNNDRNNISLVLENTSHMIQIVDQVQQQKKDSTIKLYAFRIGNIADTYQSVFKQYVYSYDQQIAAVADMTQAFHQLEQQLETYVDRVSVREKELVSFLQQLVMMTALLATGLGIVAMVSLSKRITTPIKALNRSAQQILLGDFSHEVCVDGSSKDEIVDLGNSFNKMSRKLEHSFKALSRHREHLEELVRERTREIEAEIARHKETQNALENEKDRALQYFDMAGSIFVVLNPDTSVAMINKAGRKVLGYPSHEIVGRSWFDFIPIEDREKTRKAFEDVMCGDVDPYEFFENDILTRQGEKRTISWHNSLLKDENGKILATLSSGEDTTDATRMAQEHEQLQDQLAQARKMEAIGTLAGGIAHDFNNILYPVIGYTEMAMGDLSKDHPLQEYLNNVLKGALRARELVRQILTFSRKKKLDTGVLRIQPIIKEALKLLRSSIPKNIAIESRIDDQAKPIMGDPTQIYEIIMNLCTNAYHAMETTGGCLTVTLHEEKVLPYDQVRPDVPAGDYCVICVKDTGQGISKDIMNQIFEPYFTTKQVGKGSGLGLAVIHGIVNSYGGTIHVESQIGRGTTFEVFLPGIKEEVLFSQPEKPVGKKYGKETVLFVDDEEAIVKVGSQALAKRGYTVVGKTDSQQALSAFKAEPDKYDILVTDMTMPEMMGTQLIEKIQRIRPDFPVILCTGFSEQIDQAGADEMGVQGYLTKPVLMDDLSLAIRKILDRKKQVT
ncbi:MAG: ATP-binding protein [Pseudomonadota bacterium]